MKHRGTKILAMLLTLVLLVGLVPGMSLTAYAGASIGGTNIDVFDSGSGTLSSDMTCTRFRVFDSSTLTIGQGVTLTLNNTDFRLFDNSKIELHGTLAGSAGSRAGWFDNSYINVYLSDGAKYTVTGLSCWDGDNYLRYYGYDAATDGNGTVSVKNGDADVTSSSVGYKTTSYTFTATPSDGYKFKNWTKGAGGEVLGTDASINVTCEQNGQYQVYANFEENAAYTVTYRVVNGTWSDGSTADNTETVASGAKPANVPTGMIPSAGYTGGAWNTNPADATITEATIFTYIFTATPTFNVTVSETPNGTVTASKTTATAGENITLTITPASGYQIQATTVTDVSGNPVSVSNNSFTMPAANVIVTVTFIESPVQPTTYTVSFFANGGGGVMNPVTVPANTVYTLPACGFTPPAGKQFKAWQLGSTQFAPGDSIIVDCNAEFVAIWKDDEGSGEPGYGGADEWYDGGYAPQRAWKVKLAPMVNGSAALGIMTGESTTTEFNVYPTTTIYVFPNANPGFVLDKIIWSYIDGTASYDITEAKNFVMPAMDVVVYVTFKPLGS